MIAIVSLMLVPMLIDSSMAQEDAKEEVQNVAKKGNDKATVTTITGQQMELSISSIENGVLNGADGGADQQINMADLMMIQTGRAIDDKKPKIRVMMSGGGVLAATKVRFNGEQFTLQTSSGELVMPPDSIKAFLFDDQADRSRFDRAIANRSVQKDTIIANTTSGQRTVGGLIESIDDSKVILNFDDKSRPISLSKIVGIVPADLKPAKPGGQIGSVKLVDGSSVSGAIVGLASGQLTIALPGDATIELPMARVSAISLQSDRVVYLSDLQPTDVSQNSLATLEFGWQADRSVQLNPIRLYSAKTGKTTTYTKGIGTHSACRIEFENADGFNRFAAVVGIDVETEGNGDCEVGVWADGIQIWNATITGDGEPHVVDVPIDGMKKVALVVRNGKHLDLGDHVDWADARFLKTDDSGD